jgi:hypothetical protein
MMKTTSRKVVFFFDLKKDIGDHRRVTLAP